MKNSAVTIVLINVEQDGFDPGAVDAQIYCINNNINALVVSHKSESFTTINENSGETASHGTEAHEFVLQPGEIKLIAEVAGWEWDGHVGMEIFYKDMITNISKTESYDFKSGEKEYYVDALKLTGTILPALLY